MYFNELKLIVKNKTLFTRNINVMAATPSQMIPLGTELHNFELLNPLSGDYDKSTDLISDKLTVIVFICNHCPFVHHISKAFSEIAKTYKKKGVAFIAISSNDVQKYPEDAPELMAEFATKEGYNFPYLYDEDQRVAKAYGAECTPDFFVYDQNQKLAYRGRFDETRPNMGNATGKELIQAMDLILETGKGPEEQLPSIGCNIKWK